MSRPLSLRELAARRYVSFFRLQNRGPIICNLIDESRSPDEARRRVEVLLESRNPQISEMFFIDNKTNSPIELLKKEDDAEGNLINFLIQRCKKEENLNSVIALLIDDYQFRADLKNDSGELPLHIASSKNFCMVANTLIEAYVHFEKLINSRSLEFEDAFAQTPLAKAISPEMVILLLKNGAKISMLSKNEKSQLVALMEDLDIKELFSQLCIAGNIDGIEFVYPKIKDLPNKNKILQDSLLERCKHSEEDPSRIDNYLRVVTFLINNGAILNQEDLSEGNPFNFFQPFFTNNKSYICDNFPMIFQLGREVTEKQALQRKLEILERFILNPESSGYELPQARGVNSSTTARPALAALRVSSSYTLKEPSEKTSQRTD